MMRGFVVVVVIAAAAVAASLVGLESNLMGSIGPAVISVSARKSGGTHTGTQSTQPAAIGASDDPASSGEESSSPSTHPATIINSVHSNSSTSPNSSDEELSAQLTNGSDEKDNKKGASSPGESQKKEAKIRASKTKKTGAKKSRDKLTDANKAQADRPAVKKNKPDTTSTTDDPTAGGNKEKADPVLLLSSKNTQDLFAESSPLRTNLQSNHKDLVVTFVDTGYLDTFSVWLSHYKRHNNTNRILCLFALSSEAYGQIQNVLVSNQHNIQSNLESVVLVEVDVNTSGELGGLWAKRVRILQQLLTTFPTNNVLYTDVDALWLRDPQLMLSGTANANSTIIASRGTFPPQCSFQGATLCFGFTYFRNTPQLQTLTKEMIQALPDNRNDDQMAINCVLSQSYQKVGKANNDSGSLTQTYKSNTTDNVLQVSVLPYEDVVRRCDKMKKIDKVTVAHCSSKKTGTSKLETFKKFGTLPKDMIHYKWDMN